MPFAINARCNFNCSFCDKQWSAEDAVDDETVFFKAPISELSGLRAVLGGGEPTLHPRLPHLLAGLKEQGVRRIALRTAPTQNDQMPHQMVLYCLNTLWPSHSTATAYAVL